MTTIEETKTTGVDESKPVTWLEFISEEDDALHMLYDTVIAAREKRCRLQDMITEEDAELDAYHGKTWLLTFLADKEVDGLRTSRSQIEKWVHDEYGHYNTRELTELSTVVTTLRSMISAAIFRRAECTEDKTTQDEITWQADRSKVCGMVNNQLSKMRLRKFTALGPLAREKEPYASMHRSMNKMQRRMNYSEKCAWSRTSDDGNWVHDDGRVWDETEHNGMLPWDEAGDTEEEEEGENNGGVEVSSAQRVLVMNAPPPS